MTFTKCEGMTFARWGTRALGAGLIAFGLPAVIAPAFFARQVGIPSNDDPSGTVAIHSVAFRDIAFGVGLVIASKDGSHLRTWLLVRCLSELGDCLAITIAFLRGGGNRRLGALGVLAGAAAIYEAALYILASKEITSRSGNS